LLALQLPYDTTTFINKIQNNKIILCNKTQRERTRPSSLSSRLSKLEFSVTSFTLIIGSGMLVVKSPWVSQLCNQQPHRQSLFMMLSS